MKNSLKDLTLNVKKSIDREYDGELNMKPINDEDQKVVDDDLVLSIQDSYNNGYTDNSEDIIVDHSDESEDKTENKVGNNVNYDESVIEPNEKGVDTIRLIKVKSVTDLSDEFNAINKTGVPAVIDLKYIQERRPSEFKKLGESIKIFKEVTGGEVVLLGSTKNVIIVTPPEVRLMK